MRLERHEMAGFNHLAGTFAFDLRELPAGVIAIVGPNGAGKTSLALEGPLAGLFGPGAQTRAFASREGTLATYATSRDAYIDDVWTLAGVGTFRVRVNVDGLRRMSEAVIEQILPDGRRVPLNDGKTSTFRTAVAERFPSQRLLLASAFAGQTRRGNFGELGQRERMELFVELADLGYLQEKAETAKACATLAETHVVRLRAALDVWQHNSQPARLGELRRAQVDAQQQRDAARAALAAARTRLLRAEEARTQAQDQAQRHAAALSEIAGIEVALTRAEREQRGVQGETVASQRAYEDAARRARERCADAVRACRERRIDVHAEHDKIQHDREQRIANNTALLANAPAIRAAVERVEAVTAQLREARETQRVGHERLAAAQEQIRVRERQLHAADVAGRDAARARERAGLLATVKFGEPCATPPACPLVSEAAAARDEIPALEDVARHAVTLRAAVADWTREAATLSHAGDAARDQIAVFERELHRVTPQAAQAAALDVAEHRITECRHDIVTADETREAALARLVDEQAAIETQWQSDLAVVEQERQSRDAALAARSRTLEDDLHALRATCAAAKARATDTASCAVALIEAESACHEAQAEISLNEQALARLDAERASLDAEIERWQEAHRAAAEHALRVRVIEDELLAWQTLARACGRDGLQRLEIDAAGPVVSDLANQLLEVGYGPRFAVQVVTQVATADKRDVKERFTIEVLDNAHGGEARDLGDLSGGERVVVDEAIRAALACYVNLRTRQPCRTLWRDETTGALSSENVAPYVAMLRKLRELSGAEQVLFITHSEEAAALADAVVEVENGTARVRA